jgi:hypothetical protein
VGMPEERRKWLGWTNRLFYVLLSLAGLGVGIWLFRSRRRRRAFSPMTRR